MVRPMDNDDEDDGLREINQTAREVMATVFAVADQVQPPENARAMLLGIAAIMISRNMREGQEPTADRINEIWLEEGFPWRMIRALQ
jgi:hypothetical protein